MTSSCFLLDVSKKPKKRKMSTAINRERGGNPVQKIVSRIKSFRLMERPRPRALCSTIYYRLLLYTALPLAACIHTPPRPLVCCLFDAAPDCRMLSVSRRDIAYLLLCRENGVGLSGQKCRGAAQRGAVQQQQQSFSSWPGFETSPPGACFSQFRTVFGIKTPTYGRRKDERAGRVRPQRSHRTHGPTTERRHKQALAGEGHAPLSSEKQPAYIYLVPGTLYLVSYTSSSEAKP